MEEEVRRKEKTYSFSLSLFSFSLSKKYSGVSGHTMELKKWERKKERCAEKKKPTLTQSVTFTLVSGVRARILFSLSLFLSPLMMMSS